jgi:hypothetical protein
VAHGRAGRDAVTRKLLNMSEETPEPSEQPTDERWGKLHDVVAALMNMGIADIAEMTEMINAARNEDVRATAISTAEHVKAILKPLLELYKDLVELLGAREVIAERQYKTEMVLLDRIQELSGDAEVEALYTLSATYANLRSNSVAPGWYTPDERHSGPVGNS